MSAISSPPSPTPPEAVPYADRSTPRKRRSMESLCGLMLTLASLPAGLVVNVFLASRGQMEQGRADGFGFGVVIACAALGTFLGWHSRQRIRWRHEELHGMTTATLALVGGLCILLAGAVVMLKSIFGPQ
jgi:hypothetical protein